MFSFGQCCCNMQCVGSLSLTFQAKKFQWQVLPRLARPVAKDMPLLLMPHVNVDNVLCRLYVGDDDSEMIVQWYRNLFIMHRFKRLAWRKRWVKPLRVLGALYFHHRIVNEVNGVFIEGCRMTREIWREIARHRNSASDRLGTSFSRTPAMWPPAKLRMNATSQHRRHEVMIG